MQTKKCKDCGAVKSVKDFYGMQGECKECTKKRVKKREDELKLNPDYIQKERTRGREKHARLYVGKKTTNNKYREIWKIKFPEKEEARKKLSQLKNRKNGYEYHHWSYNDIHFLDVLELTMPHHKKAHRFLIYDQERKMYRRHDTNELLDTKERHENFIFFCINNCED